MAGVLLRQGEQIMLEAFVNKTAPQDLVLRLFTNDWTPAEANDETDATEASGNGYAHIDLNTGGSWTFTGGDPSTLAYAEQTFTFTGALGNVYGYYVTQVTSGKAVIAERFSDGPYNVQNNGDTIDVTVSFTIE